MSDNVEEKTVEPAKLNKMKVAILQAEKSNVSTRNLTNPEMVELLKQTIISYADKTF